MLRFVFDIPPLAHCIKHPQLIYLQYISAQTQHFSLYTFRFTPVRNFGEGVAQQAKMSTTGAISSMM